MKVNLVDLVDGLHMMESALYKDITIIQKKDLNITQDRILMKVNEPLQIPMSNIAKAIGIEKGPFSQTVDKLVRQGYVIRKRSEEDRRIVFLEPTEKGKEYADMMKKHFNNHFESVLSNLDDEHIKELIKALQTINKTAKILLKKQRVYNDIK